MSDERALLALVVALLVLAAVCVTIGSIGMAVTA